METTGGTALPSIEQQGRNWEEKCIRFSFRKHLSAVVDANASLILFAIFLFIIEIHYIRQCSRALLRWDHAWMTGKPFLINAYYLLSLSKSNVTAKSYKRPVSSLKLIVLVILMWFLFVACFNIMSAGMSSIPLPSSSLNAAWTQKYFWYYSAVIISRQYSPPSDLLLNSSMAEEDDPTEP